MHTPQPTYPTFHIKSHLPHASNFPPLTINQILATTSSLSTNTSHNSHNSPNTHNSHNSTSHDAPLNPIILSHSHNTTVPLQESLPPNSRVTHFIPFPINSSNQIPQFSAPASPSNHTKSPHNSVVYTESTPTPSPSSQSSPQSPYSIPQNLASSTAAPSESLISPSPTKPSTPNQSPTDSPSSLKPQSHTDSSPTSFPLLRSSVVSILSDMGMAPPLNLYPLPYRLN